jgi:hypothetical protein
MTHLRGTSCLQSDYWVIGTRPELRTGDPVFLDLLARRILTP